MMEWLLIDGKARDLGDGFTVRRFMPSVQRRSVGPFVFFDHFGPTVLEPGHPFDVRPHPHIGLATVTYLLDGAIMHRDSLGSVQVIEPGAINWMTAGSGIVHSERRPPHLEAQAFTNHGIQLWAALPRSHEEMAPAFIHTPAEAIPQATLDGGVQLRVLLGQALDMQSPVAVVSPTLYLDLLLPAGARWQAPAGLAQELGVYAVDADVTLDGKPLAAHTLALSPAVPADGAQQADAWVLEAGDAPARVLVLGGAPLDGPRFIWWNFVSSRKERIVQAAQDWEAERFAAVPGEHERIPLPERRPAV